MGWWPLLAAPAAGALLPLGLAPFDWWPCSFISMAIFAYLLEHSPKRAIWLSWLYGLGLFLAGASWVYASIHDYGNAPPLLAGSLVLLFCSGMALFLVPLGLVYRWLYSPQRAWLPLLFSCCWVLAEWLRSWLLTGFPWLYAGYSQLHTPLAGFMPVAGVYGSSFAVAFIASNLIQLRQPQFRYLSIISATATVLIGLGLQSIQWTTPTGTSKTIGLVQPNLSLHDKWNPKKFSFVMRRFISQTKQLNNADIVIWPESAIPAAYQRSQGWVEHISTFADKHGYDLIAGQPFVEESDTERTILNSQWVYSPGREIQFYFKKHLVPFGEYMPLESLLRGTIDFFDLPSSHFSAGADQQPQLMASNIPIAIYICYEIAYPNLVAHNSAAAELLVTVSNDAWFGRSIGPHQHFDIARARAVESGKPLIRVTNNGISGVIKADGSVQQQLPAFEIAQALVEVETYSGSTPFSRFGESPIILFFSSLLLLISALKWAPKQ